MNRLFQGAATVDSILRGDLIERAAEAGLRSLFVGFETLTPENLRRSHEAPESRPRLFGGDRPPAQPRHHDQRQLRLRHGRRRPRTSSGARSTGRSRTGITTATFHVQTPYPGTGLHARLAQEGRITTGNWDLYDTRHVVFQPARISPRALKDGYDWAYREFYRWSSIARGVVHARDAQAPGETLRLRDRLEEVRVPVERDHPDQATAGDDPHSRGCAVESVRNQPGWFHICNA